MKTKHKRLDNYFENFKDLIDKYDYNEITKLLKKLKNFKKKIIIFGNGGSANIANHIANDLTNASKITAISFSDVGIITCFINDYGFENWVSKAIEYHYKKGDIIILISSSGMSMNMIKAALKCKKEKKYLVTLSGFSKNNKLYKFGDCRFHVNSKSYNYIELAHMQLLMSIVDLTKKN
jgi:D-sedoheptulose 7-phosphate isomerase